MSFVELCDECFQFLSSPDTATAPLESDDDEAAAMRGGGGSAKDTTASTIDDDSKIKDSDESTTDGDYDPNEDSATSGREDVDDESGEDEHTSDGEATEPADAKQRAQLIQRQQRLHLLQLLARMPNMTNGGADEEDSSDAGTSDDDSNEPEEGEVVPNGHDHDDEQMDVPTGETVSVCVRSLNRALQPGEDSGTTACVALVADRLVCVANAGDSRAVLCRSGKALDLSVDHKPEDEGESKRIHAAGGRITCDGRVNGGLNLSRAIGDHHYKKTRALPLEAQMISADPDVTLYEIDRNTDSFLVIACDGIW